MEFMMKPIISYEVHVYFAMDRIMMEPVVNYACHVNFTMDRIYDGTHSTL